MQIKETLEELELSSNEAAVYLSLLRKGRTNVGPIIKDTKLHRQIVYHALERLETMKLASYVTKNNRKHFQASSPTQLLRRVEEKKRLAETLVPNLLELQAKASDQLEVQTLYGENGFFANLKDVVESASRGSKIMRVIGGGESADFYRFADKSYDEYLELLKEKKVCKHLIAAEDKIDQFQEFLLKEPIANRLKTMGTGLSSPTYTRITEEMTSIEIYSNEPVILQIRNKAIAAGYIEHFEILWAQAKEWSV